MLASYGAVRSMTYIYKRPYVSSEGHHRTLYGYLVAFEHGTVTFDFAADADGYVGGVELIVAGNGNFGFWR
jgi:hypothetical protein